jgi:hypothetical protein
MIIDSRGYIITNNHVVSGALSIQVVLSNGTKESAQLVASGSPSQPIASRPSCRSSSRAEKCGEVTWHPMDASFAAGFADTAGFIALGGWFAKP